MENKTTKKRDFSLRMMRWRYLLKAGTPKETDLANYNTVIRAVLFSHYNKYVSQFKKVGYDIDDVMSLLKIHTVSFVGAFALENNPKKLDAFKKRFFKINGRTPTDEDILKKNQSDCFYFLKQRISENAAVSSLYGRKMRSGSELNSDKSTLDIIIDNPKNPEEIALLIEEEAFLNSCSAKLESMSKNQKKEILTNFIEKNKNNDKMKKEVRLAAKKIKELKGT